MKTLFRLLWLTLGLFYRLIVLLLFNRWLPFPQKGDAQRDAQRGPAAPARGRQAQPIFSPGAPSSEKRVLLPADLMRQFLEGLQMEHGPEEQAPPEPPPPPKPARPPRRPRSPKVATKEAARASAYGGSIAGLSRDKRALRDAVLLGSALGKRRGPFGG